MERICYPRPVSRATVIIYRIIERAHIILLCLISTLEEHLPHEYTVDPLSTPMVPVSDLLLSNRLNLSGVFIEDYVDLKRGCIRYRTREKLYSA